MDCQTINFCELIKRVIHPNEEINLTDDIDWNYLVRLAKEHNILPIFMESAVKCPSYVERSEYEKEIKETLSVVAKQTRNTSAFLELYEAFLKEDMHPLVMKGLICRGLYGGLCDHRPSGDEDILIQITEFEKAREILIKSGYKAEFAEVTENQLKKIQEITFVHPIHNLSIELHLNPIGKENAARSSMNALFEHVFEDYREVKIKGIPIRTMSHQEHFLFLIVHAFKHFTECGFGIRQMLDILLYQEKYETEINLEDMDDVLKKLKIDSFWNDILHIGNRYFGFNLLKSQNPTCPEELLEDMIQCGAFGNRTQAERTAGRRTMFATGDYLKKNQGNSLIMLWRTVFPSKSYMLSYVPYLADKPWMLPIEWVRRWARFVRQSQYNNDLAVESIKINRKRMKLLRKYNLV